MVAFKDLQLTALDGDLLIGTNGDFVIFSSDSQNIHDIINDEKGDWKQFPNVGVGIENWQYSPVNVSTMRNIIKTQLQSDGFNVTQVIIKYNASTDILDIQPNAIR